jgi:hypothetical protein
MAEKITILEAVKIQARAVIPIVKHLERELGAERAHALVRDAIANDNAARQLRRAQSLDTHPGSDDMSRRFPVESEVVENTSTTLGINMVSCQFAEYFRSIGEPAIGALLTCGVDFATQAALRPSWEFTRTQTLMSGAPYCDFRWKLKNG